MKKLFGIVPPMTTPFDENEEINSSSIKWKKFLKSLDKLDDPLLSSIFKNGSDIQFDDKTGKLIVKFAKQFAFFQDTFDETRYREVLRSVSKLFQ